MSDEKRRQKRFATRQRLWCEGQENPVLGEARNVSLGGMFIVADDEAEVGQQIKVNFKDADSEVSMSMEVMWKGTEASTGEAGIGVRIVGFDKGEDVYKRFLEKQEPAPGEAGETSEEPEKRKADEG